MRRLSISLLLVVVGGAFSQAGADSKSQLQELRERLDRLQRDYQSTRESHADATDSLRQSERAISDAKRRLLQLEGERQKTRAELDAVKGEVERTQDRIRQRQGHLAELLRQSYMRGGGDSLRLLLGGKDPNQVSRELVYLNYLSERQVQLITALQHEINALTQLKEAAAAKDRELGEIRQGKVAEQQELLKEKQARQIVLNRLSGKIRAQQRELGTLRRDEKRLTDLVARLARVAAQRKPRAGRPPAGKPTPTEPSNPVAVVTDVPEVMFGDRPFSKLKGLLKLPVRGELMNRFGAPREEGGLSWKGLFIRAAEGAEVKVVAAGRVVFAEWLRGFGNLLIVDHGQGYMSLYSNNESLYKQPGEGVKAGDAIAAAGNSGGQADVGVYFELRHQGRPIDPMAWVK